MLIPRTSTSSRLAIVNPAKGLIIYDTTTSGFWYHTGSAWAQLAGGSTGWSLTGNSAAASNFIGTINNQPLQFRVNNVSAGEIHPTSGNVFLGLAAGQTNAAGQANTAIGDHSLFANTDGNFNSSVGNYALSANTTGFNNTAIGTYALTNTTTGSHNTAVGRNALFANTTGDFNTATGEGALLNNIGFNNTANGYQTLLNNINGTNNTAVGSNALKDNTSGSYNVAVGNGALLYNTTADENTAIGSYALFTNKGSSNTAIGADALRFNQTGIQNTAIGKSALFSNSTGAYNTAIGNEALSSNTTAFSNTAGGYGALRYNTTGSYNTANGAYVLSDNTTGNSNAAYGAGALGANTTGGSNVAVGYNALANNISGNYNIAIGFQSGTGGPNRANLTNTIGIGNTFGFLNGASNQVVIGDASMYFIGGKVNWGIVSDARIKNTIVEDVKGLDFILKLRPVTYHISNKAITALSGTKETLDYPGKYDGEKIKYSGFLAQEVEQAAKAANYNFSGYDVPKTSSDLYTLKYAEFVVPLVKAMQEQQIIITSQQKQIDLLEKRLAALESKL